MNIYVASNSAISSRRVSILGRLLSICWRSYKYDLADILSMPCLPSTYNTPRSSKSVACPKRAPSLRPPAPPANVPAGRSLAQKACSMGLPLLFAHGPRPQTFLQAAAWPRKLFLWASEGNVRDPRAPPPNPSRQLAGLPPFLQAAAFSMPQLGPESFFYGLPKATLETHGPRPQTPPRQPAGLPRPLCGLSEACPFSSPTGPARKRSCRPQLGHS